MRELRAGGPFWRRTGEERGESYNAKATGPSPLSALGHGQKGERRNLEFGGGGGGPELIKEGGIWEDVKVSVLSAFLCCQTGVAEAPSQPFFPRDACWLGMGLLGGPSPQKRICAQLLLKENVGSFPLEASLGDGLQSGSGLGGVRGVVSEANVRGWSQSHSRAG